MICTRLEYATVVWSPNAKKRYKEIRKDPKSSHKNGTRIKGADMKTD